MEGDKYIKVSIDTELPIEDGKYIVFTKTGAGNQNIFATNCHLRQKKGKTIATWGCTNQIVTHWLKKIK